MSAKGVFHGAKRTTTLEPGDVLFNAGDVGDEMFGVISGELELRLDDRVISKVGPGETFGELAIVDSGPRTLTATALEACEIAVIDKRTFLFLVHETPTFAIDVMKSMASLIRSIGS